MNEYENFNWQQYPIKGYGINYTVQGMEYTCVRRFQGQKYNTIYNRIKSTGPFHFYLLGKDNQIVELIRDDLLKLMKSNKIKIKNLKLSSDDKIYFVKEYEDALERKSQNLEQFKKQYEYAKRNEQLHIENLNDSSKKPRNRMVDNKNYEEEVRKGMILRVSKTSWSLKYPMDKTINDFGVSRYSDGVYIMGTDIDEHIKEIKDCYAIMCNHLSNAPDKDFVSQSLCEGKYSLSYNAKLQEFLFSPCSGALIVVGKQGMQQWVRDIEYCTNRVSQIRDELGWKSHKGLFGKFLGAY